MHLGIPVCIGVAAGANGMASRAGCRWRERGKWEKGVCGFGRAVGRGVEEGPEGVDVEGSC